MSQAESLADQIEKSIIGPAWYGLSLLEAINEVNAEEALFQLDEGSHSIWQQVWHLNNWIRVFHNRLNGKETPWLAEEEDWPSTPALSEHTHRALGTKARHQYRRARRRRNGINERGVTPQSRKMSQHA